MEDPNLHNVEKYAELISTYHSDDKETIPIALAVNKIDIEHDSKKLEAARKFAKDRNWLYQETSAKENDGVSDLFENLIKDALKRVFQLSVDDNNNHNDDIFSGVNDSEPEFLRDHSDSQEDFKSKRYSRLRSKASNKKNSKFSNIPNLSLDTEKENFAKSHENKNKEKNKKKKKKISLWDMMCCFWTSNNE